MEAPSAAGRVELAKVTKGVQHKVHFARLLSGVAAARESPRARVSQRAAERIRCCTTSVTSRLHFSDANRTAGAQQSQNCLKGLEIKAVVRGSESFEFPIQRRGFSHTANKFFFAVTRSLQARAYLIIKALRKNMLKARPSPRRRCQLRALVNKAFLLLGESVHAIYIARQTRQAGPVRMHIPYRLDVNLRRVTSQVGIDVSVVIDDLVDTDLRMYRYPAFCHFRFDGSSCEGS